MTVSQSEITQMAKLIQLMNDKSENVVVENSFIDVDQSSMSPEDRRLLETMGNSERKFDPVSAKPSSKIVNNNDLSAKDHMKNILSNFYKASSGVFEDAKVDRELRESLVTERTPNGARIGRWEIRVKTIEGRKFYDVGAIGDTNLVIAELTLYEAATALVRILNNGKCVNSRDAVAILTAENDYSKALQDAIRFKKRISSSPSDPRIHIFEDRYDEAKHRALGAKDRVLKLNE